MHSTLGTLTLVAVAIAVAACTERAATTTSPAPILQAEGADGLPAPDARLDHQDGSTVTLAWTDDCEPGGTCRNYEVFDGSTLWTTGYGIDQVTFSRLHAGETHSLTVRYFFVTPDGRAYSPSSTPIDVAVPPTGDVTSPSAPTNVVARFNDATYNCDATWTPATDDVTPQAQILYEVLDSDGVRENDAVQPYPVFVSGSSAAIRAVDASGNRSASVRIASLDPC
jgi:hypothetical protein